MSSENKDKLVENEQLRASLKEAWSRFADFAETADDLALISKYIKNDGAMRECYEVLDKVWNQTFSNASPLETGERKKLIMEAAAMFAKNKHRNSNVRAPKRTLLPVYRLHKIWYAAAAAVLIGLLIPALVFVTKQDNEQMAALVQYVDVVTGSGEVKTFLLPDYTKVTLNAESQLSYPAVFENNERIVELQGGAVFEVAHDSLRQFVVTTKDMSVKVLGTVFDVTAYDEDQSLLVSVISGKVEVDISDGNIQLEQNQQLKVDKPTGNFERYTVDAEKYLSWMQGKLYFHRTPVREVVNMLNRSYPQLIFELAEGEYTNLITGGLDINLLETMYGTIIHSFGLEYKRTGNKITLYIK